MHAAVIAVLVLAACGPGSADRQPATDSTVADGYDWCAVDPSLFTQTAIKGTTPVGWLDGLTYVYLRFDGGFCGGRYVATFMEQPSGCPRERVLRLSFPALEDDTITFRTAGTVAPASAMYTGVPSAQTGIAPEIYSQDVEFRISRLDPPSDPEPRVSGRFVSTGQDWTFDIYVDLVMVSSSNCL